MKEILSVEHLCFDYSDSKVLKDISFSIEKGDFLGIVGANGAGKSTLIKLILGILPFSSGTIQLFGEEIQKITDRSKIGYVSQKANSFNSSFPATIEEVVLANRYSKRGLFHRYTKEDYEKCEYVLELVGMEQYKKRLIGRLSGGQQQRVFIARAIVSEPEIIFMDEPTVGIDGVSVESINQIIQTLNRKGITIVMTNHHTPSLVNASNKILRLCEHGNGELIVKKNLSIDQLDALIEGRRVHNHA